MMIFDETKTHSTFIGYILWALGGFMGAHRFYFGRPVSGTIYFISFVLFGISWVINILFIPFLCLIGIAWLVDAFLMPSLSQSANQRFEKGPYDFTIAWLLHTYFGIFGLHRFYLGKWGTGLLYFFTGGLAGIGYCYDYLGLNTRVSERNALQAKAWWA